MMYAVLRKVKYLGHTFEPGSAIVVPSEKVINKPEAFVRNSEYLRKMNIQESLVVIKKLTNGLSAGKTLNHVRSLLQ